MVPNWRVVLIVLATEALLVFTAWRHIIEWHTPIFFMVGAVCPAFGVKPDGGMLGRLLGGRDSTP